MNNKMDRGMSGTMKCISQLVRAVWLVNFAGRILLYGLSVKFESFSFPARPFNLRDIINILLPSFPRFVL